MFTFLYPSDYFKPKAVDEQFLEESLWLKECGHKIITLNDISALTGETVIIRGWMMNEDEYKLNTFFVESKGGKMLTSLEDYYASHHLPNWYPKVSDLTPETLIVSKDSLDALEDVVSKDGWTEFFVKDYVKSLTTKHGSIARSLSEVKEIIASLDEYRTLEGGVCLRKVHSFISESEIRYFSLNGKVYSPTGTVSELAEEISKRIGLPFISIDIIKDVDGKEWLVETGDGQVSEFKKPWFKEAVQKVFSSV